MWVRIESWHIVADEQRDGKDQTLCGLEPDEGSALVDDFPGNEKTCENCLRINARDVTERDVTA